MDPVMSKIANNSLTLVGGKNASVLIPDLIYKIINLDSVTTFIFLTENETVYHNYFKKRLPSIRVGNSENNNCQLTIMNTSKFKKSLIECVKHKKYTFKQSIIILDKLETATLDNYIIMTLWAYLYDCDTSKLSKLVLFSNSEYVIETPFILDDDNTVKTTSNSPMPEWLKGKIEEPEGEEKMNSAVVSIYTKEQQIKLGVDKWGKVNEPELIYYSKGFLTTNLNLLNERLKDSVITKHEEIPLKENEKSTWLVYMPSTVESNRFYYMLKNDIENADVIMVTETTNMGVFENIFSHSEKRKIIITSIYGLDIKNVNGVFDSMMYYNLIENSFGSKESILANVSKNMAQIHLNSITSDKGFCYRMCDRSTFEKFYTNNLSEKTKFSWVCMLLDFYSTNVEIDNLIPISESDEKLKQTVHTIKNLNLIYKKGNDYCISKKGKFVLDLSILNYKTCLIIYEWIEKRLPIFPGIVVACIIEKFNLNYYSKINEKFNNNLLTENLKIWYRLASELKNLDIDKNKLKDFCKENNYRISSICLLIKYVKETTLSLMTTHDVELGLFDVDNVFRESKSVMCKVLKDRVLRVHSKKDKIYHNINGKLYELENKNLISPLSSMIVITSVLGRKDINIVKRFIPLD